MTFKLQINCDNAAFDGDPNPELARILEYVALEVRDGIPFGNVRDINGNKVGHFEIKGKQPA